MVKRLRNFVARVTQNVVYYCPPILFAMMDIMHCSVYKLFIIATCSSLHTAPVVHFLEESAN